MFSAPSRLVQARRRDLPSLSLLAVVVAAAMQVPYASAAETTEANNKEQNLVVNATTDSASSTQETDYNVPVTRSATKMALTARDTPQSVSVISKQRMEDQQLQSLDSVLRNTTGISVSNDGTSRSNFYSRGFFIDSYMVDGIPTSFEERWNFGDALSDTTLYDRIEVVRGSTGLMSGTGEPSASINLIRKHATSKEFVGNVSASYGTWDQQRYVADLSAPLTESGNVRGRVVTGYQDGDSWMDRYHETKKFLYGVVDADLTDSTTVSVGYQYQQNNATGTNWSGVPAYYLDGGKTNYDRSTNTAPDWAYNNQDSNQVFASLKQDFANGWQFNLLGSRTETNIDSKKAYIDGYFDRNTGAGVSQYANYDVVAGTGYNVAKRTVHALDAYASGPYDLFGRQHELMAGVGYSRQHTGYTSAFTNLSTSQLGDFNEYNSGTIAEPDWDSAEHTLREDTIHQQSAYTATRISLADPLHLIVGARYTRWSLSHSSVSFPTSASESQETVKNRIMPYAGLVYDINDTYSAYASYTSIFKPQAYRNASGAYLTPVTGNSYETGIKGDWLNSRVTASLAVFRIEQDHLGATDYSYIPNTTEYAYYEENDTVSKGIEFEVNGAVTDNLQMTFGATRYMAKDGDNEAVNPQLPRTTVKLFTSYRLPMLQDLTVGGGVNWQTHTWNDIGGPNGVGTIHAEQGSYALVDLFARYQFTKQLSVQGNLNNLFDKKYSTAVSATTVYGAPFNASVSVNYNF